MEHTERQKRKAELELVKAELQMWLLFCASLFVPVVVLVGAFFLGILK